MGNRRFAYLMMVFPALSETFITNELASWRSMISIRDCFRSVSRSKTPGTRKMKYSQTVRPTWGWFPREDVSEPGLS